MVVYHVPIPSSYMKATYALWVDTGLLWRFCEQLPDHFAIHLQVLFSALFTLTWFDIESHLYG
jgi:hypothetical protein